MLEDVRGALWTHERIESHRVYAPPCDVLRIVVAIDPAVSAGEDSNETGIIIAGQGVGGHGYLLKDLSGRMSPHRWAQEGEHFSGFVNAQPKPGEPARFPIGAG